MAAKTERPEKTKAEFVRGLRKLADIIEAQDGEPTNISKTLYVSVYNKAALLTEIKRYGGVWHKSLSYGGENIQLTSRELPVLISVPRDKVCRKTVRYDCEPMFSPDDEKEIDAAMLATA